MNKVGLCQLVQHLLDYGILLLGLGLLGRGTQTAHSCTHSLSIVAVMEAALLFLTDSL